VYDYSTKKIIFIHEVSNEIEAHVVKGFLEKQGIKPVVRSMQPDPRKSGLLGKSKVLPPWLAPRGIYVKKKDIHKARSAIFEYQ
jgi:hypothetical protein